MDKIKLFKNEDVSIYRRDGKWYWTVKSKAFDTLDEAYKNASAAFDVDAREEEDFIPSKRANDFWAEIADMYNGPIPKNFKDKVLLVESLLASFPKKEDLLKDDDAHAGYTFDRSFVDEDYNVLHTTAELELNGG